MNKIVIKAENAPEAIGSYSQAIESEGVVYLSGQIPLDPESMELVTGGFVDQAEQVFRNIYAVLHAAELDWSHVVKLNVYLVDLEDFAALNEVMSRHLTSPFPARAAVQVAALPKGAMIEIDGIAFRDSD
ncbi:MAG: RidA family protein [Pseudomonadota bacterium]